MTARSKALQIWPWISVFQAQDVQLLLPPESAQEARCAAVTVGAFAFPPGSDGVGGESRRVMRDAYEDGATIIRRVINAIGDAHAAGIRAKVVIIHQNGRAVPFGAAVFEVADHFAFLAIDTDDGYRRTFDDTAVGLVGEPFVCGAPEILDRLAADITEPGRAAALYFSDRPFPRWQAELVWLWGEWDGNWYRLEGTEMEG